MTSRLPENLAVSRSPSDGRLTRFGMTQGGWTNAGRSFRVVMFVDIAAFVAATQGLILGFRAMIEYF